jgi:hypothetical protein
MSMRVWVGTSRLARKELFAVQPMKTGTRMIQDIRQGIAQAATAERFHTVAHVGQDRSSRGKPNGDHHPFPVQEATEEVAYPLHPAIFATQ